MKEFVEKLKNIESTISQENGPFDLFALFLREDSLEKWDLLVAAKWIENDKMDSLRRIASSVQQKLSTDEIMEISRIVIIDENNPALAAIHRAINIEHGVAEIKESNFFGLQIKHAFIITSQRRQLGAA